MAPAWIQRSELRMTRNTGILNMLVGYRVRANDMLNYGYSKNIAIVCLTGSG